MNQEAEIRGTGREISSYLTGLVNGINNYDDYTLVIKLVHHVEDPI